MSSVTKNNTFLTGWHLFLLALVFSIAPLWITYSQNMWNRGHYQYFPLLFVAVAYFVYARWGEIVEHASLPSRWLVYLSFAIVAAAFAVGHLLNSGFIGIVASVLAVHALMYARFGFSGLRKLLTVSWLLIFAIPLPLDLDDALMVRMQFFASKMASSLLDGAGVMHFRDGVVLVTEKSQFLTEEACSGIRSLFSTLAVVGILSVSMHHHWFRICINLFQSVGWVLLCNAIRVAVVVVLADRISPWFATGTGHELVGLAIFALILAMVVSTDNLVSLFFYSPTISIEEAKREAVGVQNGDSFFSGHRPAMLTIAFGFVLIGLLGVRVAWVNFRGIVPVAMVDMPPPAEDDLPKVIGQWELASFEHVQRSGSSLFATNSHVWRYRNNDSSFLVSVDSPWAEWHNLATCYRASGWDLSARYFVPDEDNGNSGAVNFTRSELRMNKGSKHGVVLFAVFDRNGRELSPGWRAAASGWRNLPLAILTQAAASLGVSTEGQLALRGLALPATTIQLLREDADPLSRTELDEIRGIFMTIRRSLLSGQRWRDTTAVRSETETIIEAGVALVPVWGSQVAGYVLASKWTSADYHVGQKLAEAAFPRGIDGCTGGNLRYTCTPLRLF